MIKKNAGETLDNVCFRTCGHLEHAPAIYNNFITFRPENRGNPLMLIFTKDFVYADRCKYKNGIFSMENYFL